MLKSIKALCLIGLLSMATILAIVSHQQHSQVEAGKKKVIATALLAALLLKGGKKIVLPLPLPVPIPFLKQSQPVYYKQPQYEPAHYEPSYQSYEHPTYEQSSYPSYR